MSFVIRYSYRLRPEPAFEYVSESVTGVVGYTPAEHYADPFLGRRLIHPDDADVLERCLSTGADLREPVRLRWLHKNGSLVDTCHFLKPVSDASGAMVGLEGVAIVMPELTGAVPQKEPLRVLIGADGTPDPAWAVRVTGQARTPDPDNIGVTWFECRRCSGAFVAVHGLEAVHRCPSA